MKKNILWILFAMAIQVIIMLICVLFVASEQITLIILRISECIIIPLLMMLFLKIVKSTDNTFARAFAISVSANVAFKLILFFAGEQDMFPNHTLALMMIAYALVFQKYKLYLIFKKI